MSDDAVRQGREFLKDNVRQTIDFSRTAQNRGVAPPPFQKPYPEGVRLIGLPPMAASSARPSADLSTAIHNRRSRRRYAEKPLTLNDLSYLLWACQGLTRVANPAVALRTVPSAGCRHALETYVSALNVEGLAQAVYRFLPLEHALILVDAPAELAGRVAAAALGQSFAGEAAVTLTWTTLPERMEWRYGLASYKEIALDAGHACQNVYLACEAIGCVACAIAAYNQPLSDRLVGVDGEDEFVIYHCAVGKNMML